MSQQPLPECTGSELAIGSAMWRVVWDFRSSRGPSYQPAMWNERFSVLTPIYSTTLSVDSTVVSVVVKLDKCDFIALVF